VRPAKTMYGGRVRGDRSEVTKVLIGINVAIFLITLSSGGGALTGAGSSSLYDRFALVPPAVAHGEWYRVVSSMFLHYGVLHIAFNMWALWVVGSQLEGMLGRLRFASLYLLSGIGGSVLSFSTGPLLSPAAGASGAIFGLFGAFFVILRRRNIEAGGMLGLIVINLVLSFTISNIDWRGHIGGLVVGVVLGLIFVAAPAGPMRDRLQALGAVAVAVVLLAAGLVGAAHVRHECPSFQSFKVPGGTAYSCTAFPAP
jgi:membrane associated rhomboid family serine protease